MFPFAFLKKQTLFLLKSKNNFMIFYRCSISSPSLNLFQIIIRGVVGGSQGDIAIDEVYFEPQACPEINGGECC